MSAPANLFKPLTKRESAEMARSIGLFVDRIVRQRVRPNPSLAKAPVTRDETRFYTKADLFRRWLRRGERRTAEAEAAKLILDMPEAVAPVLVAVRATHARLDDISGRQVAVLQTLAELEPEVPA